MTVTQRRRVRVPLPAEVRVAIELGPRASSLLAWWISTQGWSPRYWH